MSVLEIQEASDPGNGQVPASGIVICLRVLARLCAGTTNVDDARAAILLQEGEE